MKKLLTRRIVSLAFLLTYQSSSKPLVARRCPFTPLFPQDPTPLYLYYLSPKMESRLRVQILLDKITDDDRYLTGTKMPSFVVIVSAANLFHALPGDVILC